MGPLTEPTAPHALPENPAVQWAVNNGEADDLLSFINEDTEQAPKSCSGSPWVVLIVDDEPQVHEATTLALHRMRVADRPLHFLHAHSGEQARTLIADTGQIDLILLDVVMETRDAGLRLVETLRGPMQRNDLKILIRSGQPGGEQEQDVTQRFAVDGYMQKTRQTQAHLFAVISELLLGSGRAS